MRFGCSHDHPLRFVPRLSHTTGPVGNPEKEPTEGHMDRKVLLLAMRLLYSWTLP